MKLAFITPRYGADITSGAEHGCRLLAEQISQRHTVEVLTTCASDPGTWRNESAEGVDRMRGVLVRRFTVTQPHDRDAYQQMSRDLLARPHGRPAEMEWVRQLGPWSPTLIEYIERHHRSYDALVFFSLAHASTVHGLRVAPGRSILFPHLRLDPVLRFGLWPDILSSVGALGLFSAAERRLLRDYVGAQMHVDDVVGVGIAAPHRQSYPRHQQDPADAPVDEDEQAIATEDPAPYLSARGAPFRRRHRLYGRLAMYDGPVDSHNGSEEMLEYFDRYAAADPDTSLVLMGVKMMKIPEEGYLRSPGLISDRERMTAYESADVAVAPAGDDLLALPLLESFAVGTPVLANAHNPAAVEHCRRAGAGLYYANEEEFVEAMRLLTSDSRLRETLGENGRIYVRDHFQWDMVIQRFERLVAMVRNR